MNADLSSWLESDPRWPKFYYADVDAGKWYAGVGQKSCLKLDDQCTTKEVEKKVREFTNAHGFSFCAMRFDTGFAGKEEWQEFGSAQCVAPEELRVGSDFESPFVEAQSFETPIISKDWRELFERSADAFNDKRLEKVVLAYRDEIDRKDNVWERMMSAPATFRFAFSPAPGHYFYGASPELLFRKEGSRIESDALAGTRPGNQNAEDELLGDEKDRFEHQLVIDFLVEKLTNFCTDIEVSETKIKELRHLIHLHTLVSGKLESESEIFSNLHPTPALCGSPQNTALEFLRTYEGFDRGWYGGTLGVIDRDFESFTVAIRSVLQTPNEAFVYFGAGVVAESDCESEWKEIHSKRAAILSNLGEQA